MSFPGGGWALGSNSGSSSATAQPHAIVTVQATAASAARERIIRIFTPLDGTRALRSRESAAPGRRPSGPRDAPRNWPPSVGLAPSSPAGPDEACPGVASVCPRFAPPCRPAVLGGCHAGGAAECLGEVRLVGVARGQCDRDQRLVRAREPAAGVLDPEPPEVLTHGAPE